MDIAQRIAQFEAMVRPEADPNNDMAWFSLGQAYAQAGRQGDAAAAFLRCTAINTDMSKAYQLAGQAFIAAGQKGKAAEVLLEGYKVAASKGDRMPMKAMGDLLTGLGVEPPAVKSAAPAPAATVADGSFIDRKTGKPGTKMIRPPFKGPIGAWIGAHISQETFDDWIRQGTKVINEMRLDLSRDEHSETYDRFMREYLGIDDELYEQLTGRKPAASSM